MQISAHRGEFNENCHSKRDRFYSTYLLEVWGMDVHKGEMCALINTLLVSHKGV
jgi:hypothetical protein